MSTSSAPTWRAAYPPPQLRYSFFLSHVQEDATSIKQLRRAIDREFTRRGRSPQGPFLDFDDWPQGAANASAIRDALLHSEFLVAWISPEYLRSARGWVWMELTLGQLLEDSLNFKQLGISFPFVLAVFRGVALADIERTPWLDYWSRAVVRSNESISMAKIARRLVDIRDRELLRRPLT